MVKGYDRPGKEIKIPRTINSNLNTEMKSKEIQPIISVEKSTCCEIKLPIRTLLKYKTPVDGNRQPLTINLVDMAVNSTYNFGPGKIIPAQFRDLDLDAGVKTVQLSAG